MKQTLPLLIVCAALAVVGCGKPATQAAAPVAAVAVPAAATPSPIENRGHWLLMTPPR
jgi:hypothetical protein